MTTMKHLSATLALLIFAIISALLPVKAQNVQVKPNISYTQSHPKYILGGLEVEGASQFDEELLRSISWLIVGET